MRNKTNVKDYSDTVLDLPVSGGSAIIKPIPTLLQAVQEVLEPMTIATTDQPKVTALCTIKCATAQDLVAASSLQNSGVDANYNEGRLACGTGTSARLAPQDRGFSAAPRRSQSAAARAPCLSIGSVGHRAGQCRPCAYFHSEQGCHNSVRCKYCHLCPPGAWARRLIAQWRCDSDQKRILGATRPCIRLGV